MEVATVDHIIRKSRVIGMTHVLQDGDILFFFEDLFVGLGVIETDIDLRPFCLFQHFRTPLPIIR